MKKLKIYYVTFIGGGWNSVRAINKAEAKKLMKQRVGSKFYKEIGSWKVISESYENQVIAATNMD